MKKLFGFIMFIVVAVAVFTPCCTIDNCEADQAQAPTPAEDDFSGTCSPFFSCAGCAAITCSPKPVEVPRHHQPQLVHVTSLAEYPLTAFSTVPWQPPRAALTV